MKDLINAIAWCESRLKFLAKTNPIPTPKIREEMTELESRIKSLRVHLMITY